MINSDSKIPVLTFVVFDIKGVGFYIKILDQRIKVNFLILIPPKSREKGISKRLISLR